jgi:hypothetical protein
VEAEVKQGRTTFSGKQGQTPFPSASFANPAFDAVRPWLDRLAADRWPTLQELSKLAAEQTLVASSGKALRFVAPQAADDYYEVKLHRSGEVQTRTANWHDLFNALAWLAFPRTKARINAMHAERIPHESGKRSPLRDMLTLLDEGGAVVACEDPELEALVREHRWKELFWDRRDRVHEAMHVHVLGHAVMEAALKPWPGITCKAIFVRPGASVDAQAERWLAGRELGTTQDLASLPVFGYPGWLPDSASEAFYDDARYFRPLREKGSDPISLENVVRP